MRLSSFKAKLINAGHIARLFLPLLLLCSLLAVEPELADELGGDLDNQIVDLFLFS